MLKIVYEKGEKELQIVERLNSYEVGINLLTYHMMISNWKY